MTPSQLPAAPTPSAPRFDGWSVVDNLGQISDTYGRDMELAKRVASEYDSKYPDSAPHRAIHLAELRDGESIVSGAVQVALDLAWKERDVARAEVERLQALYDGAANENVRLRKELKRSPAQDDERQRFVRETAARLLAADLASGDVALPSGATVESYWANHIDFFIARAEQLAARVFAAAGKDGGA